MPAHSWAGSARAGRRSVERSEARYGLPFVLHGLEEHVAGAGPDQAFFGSVNHHDGVGGRFEPRLADDFVDAALVVPVFHLIRLG